MKRLSLIFIQAVMLPLALSTNSVLPSIFFFQTIFKTLFFPHEQQQQQKELPVNQATGFVKISFAKASLFTSRENCDWLTIENDVMKILSRNGNRGQTIR